MEADPREARVLDLKQQRRREAREPRMPCFSRPLLKMSESTAPPGPRDAHPQRRQVGSDGWLEGVVLRIGVDQLSYPPHYLPRPLRMKGVLTRWMAESLPGLLGRTKLMPMAVNWKPQEMRHQSTISMRRLPICRCPQVPCCGC